MIWNHCCCCCCYVASVVSDSVRPHRRQPTRLCHPWDSPGKNTGVGCHFLLQCMKVKSESEVAQSCPGCISRRPELILCKKYNSSSVLNRFPNKERSCPRGVVGTLRKSFLMYTFRLHPCLDFFFFLNFDYIGSSLQRMGFSRCGVWVQ